MTHSQKYTKQFRGKQPDWFSGDIRMVNFSWGSNPQPTILTIPDNFNKGPRGVWTYPKKGFIKWQNE